MGIGVVIGSGRCGCSFGFGIQGELDRFGAFLAHYRRVSVSFCLILVYF